MMRSRLPALFATFAIHIALFAAWQLARPRVPADSDAPRRAIALLHMVAPPAARPAPPTAGPKAVPTARPAPLRQAALPPPADVVVPAIVAPEPPAASVADILHNAKRDIGRIDQDLRKAHPGQPIKAPPDSAQIRLASGIAHAAEMAPPRWFEAPKTSEIIDPGGYGRKRVRVITANGTYCVTYESNHAPDGRDVIRNGTAQKTTNCHEHEQPATRQKW